MADESKHPGITIFLAVLAVIGTLSAAYIGGRSANEGVQKAFEQQRTAQVADLRRSVYVDYLKAADKAYRADPADESALTAAKALVLIVGLPDVRVKAHALAQAALKGDDKAYEAAREAFIDSAQDEADMTLGGD